MFKQKYDFTGEKKINDSGVVLSRIKAITSFGDVKEGDLGGWIESEENLSHDGEAWIYDEAAAYGNSDVRGNAKLRNSAEIFGDIVLCCDAELLSTNHVLKIGPIGREHDFITFFRNQDNDITVYCNWYLGSIEGLLEEVHGMHGDDIYASVYHAAADIARLQIGAKICDEKN